MKTIRKPKCFPNSICYESATTIALQPYGTCYLDPSIDNLMHNVPFNVTTSLLLFTKIWRQKCILSFQRELLVFERCPVDYQVQVWFIKFLQTEICSVDITKGPKCCIWCRHQARYLVTSYIQQLEYTRRSNDKSCASQKKCWTQNVWRLFGNLKMSAHPVTTSYSQCKAKSSPTNSTAI